MLSENDANLIILRANRTEWDRSFLENDQIRVWLVREVASVPFDPDVTTLLDYVKQRMALAEAAQASQSQPAASTSAAPPVEPEQPYAATSSSHTYSTTSNGASENYSNTYTDPNIDPAFEFLDADASGSPTGDAPYEFGFDDFVDSTALASTSAASSSLGANGIHNSFPGPSASTSNGSRSYTTNGAGSYYGSEPLYHHQSSAQSSYQPPEQGRTQPQNLNPAVLSLNSGQPHIQPASTIAPSQLNSANRNRQSNFEIVVPRKSRESSVNGQQVTQSNQSKRQKRQHDSDSDSDSITVISSGSVSASSSRPAHPARSPPSAAAKAAAHPSLVPKASKPPTESEMAWEAIEGELKRILQQVNRTPISTVQRLFKLLHSKRFVTDNSGGEKSKGMEMLSVPPEGRQMILSVLRERSNGDFDECFVTDPRAPSLLEVWVRDLSDLAKKGPSSNPDARALSATGLPLLEVLHKLPIDLPVLRTLKGVGANVKSIGKAEFFDESTREAANQLVKKWLVMAKADSAAPKPAAKKATAPVSAQPKPSGSTTVSASTPRAVPGKKRAETPEDDAARKKRKVTPPPPAQARPPASTKPLPRSSTAPSAEAAKLPSFPWAKRKPAPSTSQATAPAKPAPAPSAVPFDPFSTAMLDIQGSKDLNTGNTSMDMLSTLRTQMASASASGASANLPKPGAKPKKTVRWKPDDDLVATKIVEKLVYGDEFGNEVESSNYFVTEENMSEHEGMAMKSIMELMDWEEPPAVELAACEPNDIFMEPYTNPDLMVDGRATEADVQEKREASSLATNYFTDDDIPATPTESATVSAEEPKPDTEVVRLQLSRTLQDDPRVQESIKAVHPGSNARSDDATSIATTEPSKAETNRAGTWSGTAAPGSLGSQAQPLSDAAPSALSAATPDLGALLAKLSDTTGGALNPGMPQQPSQQYGAPQGPYPQMHHQPPQHNSYYPPQQQSAWSAPPMNNMGHQTPPMGSAWNQRPPQHPPPGAGPQGPPQHNQDWSSGLKMFDYKNKVGRGNWNGGSGSGGGGGGGRRNNRRGGRY